VAKDGEPGLDSLKPLQGKYRWDGVDYVKDGVLAQRLKTLMGLSTTRCSRTCRPWVRWSLPQGCCT
jgi:hypothetical protein